MRSKMKFEIEINKSITQETLKTRVQNIIEVANMVQHGCGPASELEISFKESYPPDCEQGGCSCEDASEGCCNDPYARHGNKMQNAVKTILQVLVASGFTADESRFALSNATSLLWQTPLSQEFVDTIEQNEEFRSLK